MDDYKTKGDRKKKSDKAREKFERNGGMSTKHVRISEAASESRNWKNSGSKKNGK
jgi:hypothetical protein